MILIKSFIQLLDIYKNYDVNVLNIVNKYKDVIQMYQMQFDKYIFVDDKAIDGKNNCNQTNQCSSLEQLVSRLNDSIHL